MSRSTIERMYEMQQEPGGGEGSVAARGFLGCVTLLGAWLLGRWQPGSVRQFAIEAHGPLSLVRALLRILVARCAIPVVPVRFRTTTSRSLLEPVLMRHASAGDLPSAFRFFPTSLVRNRVVEREVEANSMSTFTFTAPVITPEQEEDERRALEADELTAIGD